MTQLTVYTRRGCHLCSDMLQALEGLRDELGFQLVDIDIDADAALRSKNGDDAPVVIPNLTFHGGQFDVEN